MADATLGSRKAACPQCKSFDTVYIHRNELYRRPLRYCVRCITCGHWLRTGFIPVWSNTAIQRNDDEIIPNSLPDAVAQQHLNVHGAN